MKQNMAQKLITSHLCRPADLIIGQELLLKVDQTLTHDINAVMTYLAFESLDLPRVRTKLSVSYIDHNLLQIDNKTPDDHIYLQSVAKKFGVYLSKAGNGICHTIHYTRLGKPGEFLLGGDSHTPSCGALGMLAIGVGGMDITTAMAGFPFRLEMPAIVKVNLEGNLNPGVSAKDVILEMLRRLTVKGGIGKIFEFTGDGVKTLSVPERVTIANMSAELGATTAIFPADETVREFLKAQKRETDYKEILPDSGCKYDEEITIDLRALVPLVACPHLPDNVKTVREAEKKPVQQVFIGSCTNGSYSDFKKAALVLREEKVDENVSLVFGITSRQIYLKLLEDGYISELLNAGARFTEFACGPCCGIGIAPPSKGISVRTCNRNFKGRSGTSDAELYLVSPEVAAATAIKGTLATPDEVMGDLSVLAYVHEPNEYPVNDNLLIPFAKDGSEVEITRGPNIKPLPVNTPPSNNLTCKVSLKAGDNVSTDDITPASAEFSSMRSNIPALAEFAFNRYAPDFVSRAKAYGQSIIVGGVNYGQGSSREHAAITCMFLGVKMVIAKSFARIHKSNLINHGVIPTVFEDPSDYDFIDQEDELNIENLLQQIKNKKITINNLTKRRNFAVNLDISDYYVDILLHGGLLLFIKAQLREGE
ncbi:aconitase [Acetomicrobium flavidum]|uniref:Aconitase n=1 Tax=Acetomicrobium flavidum TaxID=49896 RepID=A0ABY1JDT2_9BACT|nr:aconitase [Acetomicrobium flavidum]